MNTRDTRCLAWLCTLTLVACGEPPRDPTGVAPSFHRGGDDRGRSTVIVDASGRRGAAKTIQGGVDLAPPGGRVLVRRGTYHEQVTVTKNDLLIVADDGDDDEAGVVVVNAHGKDFGFLIENASGVTIEGFRVEHAHEADIFLEGATFNTIRRNVLTAAGHDGIEVFASSDNLIEHNVSVDNLAPNACGINLIAGSNRNVVRHNLLVNNEWGIQIAGPPTAPSLDNVISRNTTVRNRGNGIRSLGSASRTIIEGNRASGNGFAPSPITGATAAGIRIASGLGNVVRFNDIVGNALAGLRVAPNITTPFDASCNYWGSASGPSGVGPGTGDAIIVEAGGATPAFAPFAMGSVAQSRRHGGDDDDDDHHDRSRCALEVLATGLDNPRGVAFGPDGALYVVEAGKGGAGPCAPGPEGERCYGTSSAITRIDPRSGSARRVATGLPSLAGADGSAAAGAHDIAFDSRGGAFFTVGFGGDPRTRETAFGPRGADFAALARLTGGHSRLLQDLGEFEAEQNPNGDQIDTNPYGILALSGRQIVADAGGNDLIEIRHGSVRSLAVFPDRLVAAPPFLGLPPGTQIPMDAVPTSVVIGPDGSYYVAQLTGFPFPVGGANVYRVPAGGGTPEVYASGFTNIIDIAFGADGSLYVLEIAKNGLLGAFGPPNDWTGALIRVGRDGSRTEVPSGRLFAPGGVAVGHDGSLYVTNNSILSGRGEVIRIRQAGGQHVARAPSR